MTGFVELGQGATFSCENGGTITMIGTADSLGEFGLSSSGWAFYDDLYFNPYNDVTITLENHRTQTTLKHVSGDVVASFGMTSRVPNGKADIEVRGLAPNEWYRFEFGRVLAKTDGGRAHAQASRNGELIFSGVFIPNE